MEKDKLPSQIRCMAFPSPDEGDKWCAVALEMDIWGFGNTAEEAMKDLDDLVDIQIEFASGKKRLSILDHPADKKWFQLWDILQKREEEIKRAGNLSSVPSLDKTAPLDRKEAKCYFHKAA